MAERRRDYVVIGLSSLPGGGKDYIADLLVKDYGFYKVSPGDTVREILKKFGSNITREVQQQIQDRLRKKYGDDYIMELCYKKITKSNKRKIVIPGIRRPGDVTFYREKFGDSFLNIFVYASQKLRYRRLMSRRREDSPSSYAEFLRQDKREMEIFNLDKTKRTSDVILSNNDNTHRKLRADLEDILKCFD